MSKGIKVVWTSDLHIGLKTDDIDRTEEIINVFLQVVSKASELKKEGYETYLILGGDVFNDNNPSEKVIASIFPVLNEIKKNDIKTYFIVGNHESVYDPERLSCLSFIKKAKVGYPMITVVDDIASIEIAETNLGKVQFTFLPHITSATLEARKRKGKNIDELTVKSYIEKQCKGIMKKLGNGVNHYVFSHLNLSGVHPGSEENLLKKSEAYLPSILTNTPLEYSKPTIIQGHIHSHQTIGNVYVVGSPIFCSFGESNDKYFLELTIPTDFGEKPLHHFHLSNCIAFKQLELNMIGEKRDFFEINEVKDFLNDLNNLKSIVKFDITINSENFYDWQAIRNKIMSDNKKLYVKPILPRVLAKKHVRSVEQKLGLTPLEAVQVYLKKNLKKDPERAKRIYKLTKKYLGA